VLLNGPTRQLEGLPAPFPRLLPVPALSREKTGHRIKMQKVDAVTGDTVDADEIVKGYKAGAGFIEITEWDRGPMAKPACPRRKEREIAPWWRPPL
jgi:hypothetical protein